MYNIIRPSNNSVVSSEPLLSLLTVLSDETEAEVQSAAGVSGQAGPASHVTPAEERAAACVSSRREIFSEFALYIEAVSRINMTSGL